MPTRSQGLLERLYNNRTSPLTSRDETREAVEALFGDGPEPPLRPPVSNVYGEGPLLLSNIPKSCLRAAGGSINIGIDEAGRGSVLGPMIYGAAYWSDQVPTNDIPADFNDSKQLSEENREKLFAKILASQHIGFAIRVLHASEISRNMLRTVPYNLNAMSHDAAIDIIRTLVQAGVNVSHAYIDTVGIAEHYQRRLEREFPTIQFTVESKADAKYPTCSAASVLAKVTRDRMIQKWTFSEPGIGQDEASTTFGSGYPSDPTCKKWMENNINCRIFGYSDVVRFSWNPAKKALEENAAKVVFQVDVEEDEENPMALKGIKRQREQMSAFLGKQPPKRLPFFEKRQLQVVTKLL